MRWIITTILLMWCCFSVFAQTTPQDFTTPTVRIWNSLSVGKGQYQQPHSSAWLDVGPANSTKGLGNPTGNKSLVVSPKKGLQYFNNADSSLYVFDGVQWIRLLSDRDTLPAAWLSTKNYTDSLFHLHDAATVTVTSSGGVNTVSVIKSNGDAWLSASLPDNDNQTLSLSSDDTLSISGGNKVWMPYEHKIVNGYISYTGVATNTFTLPAPIDLTKTYLVVYNTAALNRQDFNFTYPVTLTTSFTTKTTDYIEVYYSVKQ